MSTRKFATQDELFERTDELAERVAQWQESDPEATSGVLDELGFLRDSWPPGENLELARSTCNRMARLIMLFEHGLGDGFLEVQKALTAAIDLLLALAAGDDDVEVAFETLQSVTRTAVGQAWQELDPDTEPGVPAEPTKDTSEVPRTSSGSGKKAALFAGDRGFLADFVSEATEHLEEIDALLLDLERDTTSTDALDGLFRCFHTVKGVADFLALSDISRLAHSSENLLDRLREGRLTCAGSTLDLMFEATDLLRNLVRAVAVSIAEDAALEPDPHVPEVISRIEAACVAVDPVDGERSRVPTDAGASGGEPSGSAVSAVSATPAARRPGSGPQRLRKTRDDRILELSPTVKVDSRRLDLLLDAIGELAVAVSVADQAARLGADNAEVAARAVEKLTRNVQELGTSLRMIPLRSTFRKLTRLSRDLAKRCGKSVQFSFAGEGTELDRTIVQQIQDPLVHILRNAIDHGLESDEERMDRGKPRVACVTARAYHKGGSVFIEVADDGRGFDPDLILSKARKMGIASESRDLSQDELLQFVFAPGFSTAKDVTSISGRGVGMDVVRRSVDRLRGSVDIESVPGKGSVITLRLPLTVAMIEGMVIRVGDQRFIVPTLAMTRVHQARPDQIRTISQREEVLCCDDRLIPIVRLAHVFEIHNAESEVTRGVIILVEGKGHTVGLLVDELLGQRQIVIKGLGRALRNVPGIAGGAVMPDGRVGLILDVQGIVELVQNQRETPLQAVG